MNGLEPSRSYLPSSLSRNSRSYKCGLRRRKAAVVKRVVLPAAERLQGLRTMERFSELKRFQHLELGKIQEFQLERISDLVKRTYKTIPFYRERFEMVGLREEGIDSFQSFERVPLLEKADVKENSTKLIAPSESGRLRTTRTAGSTGTPLVFFTGPDNIAVSKAGSWNAWGWWGVEVGEPWVRIWGHGRSLMPGWRGLVERLARPGRNYLYNYRTLSAYNLSSARMRQYWEKMKRMQPVMLLGYASALFALAKFLEAEYGNIRLPSLRVIVSTAEQMYGWERAKIEKVFGCTVANEYGTAEVGLIGYECPQGEVHLMDRGVYVEVLPLSDNSGLGEIVVTQLANDGAPLIRYRTGDIAAGIGQGCRCGRSLRTLRGLKGRAHDLIVAPDGTVVHGELFSHLMEHIEEVDRFQVVQESPCHLRITIGTRSPKRLDQDHIRAEIAKRVGSCFQVAIDCVECLPAQDSGKHRWIVSKLRDNVLSG